MSKKPAKSSEMKDTFVDRVVIAVGFILGPFLLVSYHT